MTPGSLATLLSQTYVAYTIDFDNRWEARLRSAGAAPRFLVSYVMWANFMRFVGRDGIAVEELVARCGPWNGPIHRGRMERWWGYVSTADGIITPTVSGTAALDAWDGLAADVDDAWRDRVGHQRFDGLGSLLERIETDLDLDLPDAMPVLNYADGYRTPVPDAGLASPAGHRAIGFGARLARVLLAFTIDVENGTVAGADGNPPLSLPMYADVMRVISDEPRLVKELPILAGITKEAMKPAVNNLAKRGLVDVEGAGAKMTVRRTPTGQDALDALAEAARSVERMWRDRFGIEHIDALRATLASLFDHGGVPIRAAVALPEYSWRATKPWNVLARAFAADPAGSLPHHPMLTHRGGWPDGS